MVNEGREERQFVESVLSDIGALVEAENFPTAAKRMGELRRHLELELETEKRLLHLFNARTKEQSPVAEAIQVNHLAIESHLNEACARLCESKKDSALEALSSLEKVFRNHQTAAAALLHPALDDLAKDDPDYEILAARLDHAQLGRH